MIPEEVEYLRRRDLRCRKMTDEEIRAYAEERDRIEVEREAARQRQREQARQEEPAPAAAAQPPPSPVEGEERYDPRPEGATVAARVPLMITKRMEADLRTRGFTQGEIDRMTPEQAWQHLQEEPAPGPGISAQRQGNDDAAGPPEPAPDISKEIPESESTPKSGSDSVRLPSKS
jgi:hypothetical protein